jgi:hypothetical protein
VESKKIAYMFFFFFHTRVALPAQRACHGRPNTGLAASPATSNDAIRVREMCWGEPNQASLLFSYFSQCCCARQPHSSEGMLCFCQGASRNTDLFAMAGKTASRLLAFCDSRISCGSLLTPSHSTSKSVRWQWSWALKAWTELQGQAQNAVPLGKFRAFNVPPSVSKFVRVVWYSQIQLSFSSFRLLMVHHKSDRAIDVKIGSTASSLHHSGKELMAHCFFTWKFVPGADSVG